MSRSAYGSIANRLALTRELEDARLFWDFRAFVTKVAPHLVYPEHLEPYVEALKRTQREDLRVCVSAPPRHGKTETTALFIAWSLYRDPTMKIGYASYSSKIPEKVSRKVRDFFLRSGGEMADDKTAAKSWETSVGGLFDAFGISGSVTGEGYHLIIIDDPVQDRAAAESPTIRQNTLDWFDGTISTRTEPRGTSFVIMATRWHTNDLIGTLITRGVPWINIPALDDNERALWPNAAGRKDPDPRAPFGEAWLASKREEIGDYDFSSQFLGRPVPRGASLFQPLYGFYSELPAVARVTIGVDFAYSSKTKADASCAVVMYESEGLYYVADVFTGRVSVADFKGVVSGLQHQHGGVIYAGVAATERGAIEMLRQSENGAPGLVVREVLASRLSGDKFARAQPVAAAWNAGRVLLPKGNQAPWVNSFTNEVLSFTGLGGGHDDQVDALATAHYPYRSKGVGSSVVEFADYDFSFG